MKWLKKRSYVIMLVLVGTVFMGYTGKWQIYAEPLGYAKEWCLQQNWVRNLLSGESLLEADADGRGPDADQAVKTGDMPPKKAVSAGDGTVSGGEIAEETPPPQDQTPPPQDQTPVTWREPSEIIYGTVEDDYFADAVFIGDSRTVGLFEYGGLEETAAFYASTGLTVYRLFDSPIVEVPEQKEKQTIEQALAQRSFSKIYFMIGINEMGTGTVESFMEKYKEAVEHLKELQPDAVIYLQAIIKVTTERSQQGDYINNEGIEARNNEIAKLADNIRVYYLDVNPLICDDSGGMEASYTHDGVHLKAQYISIWKDYLKTHAVQNIP